MNKTVLVMGAGTSKPYGYPIGNELVEIIYSKLQTDPKWKLMAKDFGYGNNVVMDFCQALIKSQQDTIDSFLNGRKDFLELGK